MSHGPAKTLQKYTLSTKYLYVRKDLPAFPIVNTESRDFIAAKVDGFMVLNIYRPNSGLIEGENSITNILLSFPVLLSLCHCLRLQHAVLKVAGETDLALSQQQDFDRLTL